MQPENGQPLSQHSDPPSWSLWTSSSYAIVMVLIGLPLWWKTTTVQRAPLPYHEMLTLHEFLTHNLQIDVQVYLKGFPLTVQEDQDPIQPKCTGCHYLQYNVTEEEKSIIQKSQDLYEVDNKLCSLSLLKDLNIYYVDRDDFLELFGERIVVGNCRSIYYISSFPNTDFTSLSKVLNKLTKSNSIEQEAELEFPLSAGYDILLSLLVPEPEIFDATWKIQHGIKAFIEPMLGKLSAFADFNVRSQILYYMKLNIRPKLNKETRNYEVSYDQLPVVINPVESKLTSFVSQNPALNFLVYVSPCAMHPIQILNGDGSFIDSNGFFVPQWGGIQIYNGPCSTSSNSTKPHEVSLRSIMSVIIPQFRALIGVSGLVCGIPLQYEKLRALKKDLLFHFSFTFGSSQLKTALRDWEVDMLLRKRLERLLFTSANTLMSLGNLLDQITNIVVREEVGEEVERSVNSLKASYAEAISGNIEMALHHAIISYKSSEIAFHHPSNLAQLYFPDDQKYAIYIPLFLPVGIPVLLSLKSIFQFFKNRLKKSHID